MLLYRVRVGFGGAVGVRGIGGRQTRVSITSFVFDESAQSAQQPGVIISSQPGVAQQHTRYQVGFRNVSPTPFSLKEKTTGGGTGAQM